MYPRRRNREPCAPGVQRREVSTAADDTMHSILTEKQRQIALSWTIARATLDLQTSTACIAVSFGLAMDYTTAAMHACIFCFFVYGLIS
jgi:hypothetical protein